MQQRGKIAKEHLLKGTLVMRACRVLIVGATARSQLVLFLSPSFSLCGVLSGAVLRFGYPVSCGGCVTFSVLLKER